MQLTRIMLTGAAALAAAAVGAGAPAFAATTVQIGGSGKTFASSAAQCATNPAGVLAPKVDAGLFNPPLRSDATVKLNGGLVKTVDTANPVAEVWLVPGSNAVVVALSRKTADQYVFSVAADQCSLPDTSRNVLSPDGTLEYAASGKSYATVVPGCALSPATGQPQPYVNLFDNGGYLLNVSVNGVPLTQLSALRPHTPVFLKAGLNVISAANGSLSTDYYVRNGGDGQCVLP